MENQESNFSGIYRLMYYGFIAVCFIIGFAIGEWLDLDGKGPMYAGIIVGISTRPFFSGLQNDDAGEMFGGIIAGIATTISMFILYYIQMTLVEYFDMSSWIAWFVSVVILVVGGIILLLVASAIIGCFKKNNNNTSEDNNNVNNVNE